MLDNHVLLAHCKGCSRQFSMCGPEAGKEKWTTISNREVLGATCVDSLSSHGHVSSVTLGPALLFWLLCSQTLPSSDSETMSRN